MFIFMRRKFVALILVFSFSLMTPISVAKAESEKSQIITSVATDLIGAGFSVAAALTGNVPLALASGLLTKYISLYGIKGVKLLINQFKSERPSDLGEINIYYMYLLNIKRNLYHTLINIRKSVKSSDRLKSFENSLDEITDLITGKCEENSCEVTGLDETLVNYTFINIALDAKQTVDINRHLHDYEIKATYQYLMMLYLDLIIVEQQLIETQYQVLANGLHDSIEELEKNRFLSQAEKEYQYQLLMNLALRWQKMRDQRRIILFSVLKDPLNQIVQDNNNLDDLLADYRAKEEEQ